MCSLLDSFKKDARSLARFLLAQEDRYAIALNEIKQGEKKRPLSVGKFSSFSALPIKSMLVKYNLCSTKCVHWKCTKRSVLTDVCN